LEGLNPDSANGFDTNTADVTTIIAIIDSTDATSTDDTFTADQTETDIFDTDKKLDAMRNLLYTLGGIEQKKAVMYFSGGLRTSGIDNQTTLRAAVNSAVRSNTSIYPVDVRGLQAIVPGGSASSASRRGQGLFNGGGVRGQFTQQQ